MDWIDFYTKSEICKLLGGLKFVVLTQAEYDALQIKDENTVYFVAV